MEETIENSKVIKLKQEQSKLEKELQDMTYEDYNAMTNPEYIEKSNKTFLLNGKLNALITSADYKKTIEKITQLQREIDKLTNELQRMSEEDYNAQMNPEYIEKNNILYQLTSELNRYTNGININDLINTNQTKNEEKNNKQNINETKNKLSEYDRIKIKYQQLINEGYNPFYAERIARIVVREEIKNEKSIIESSNMKQISKEAIANQMISEMEKGTLSMDGNPIKNTEQNEVTHSFNKGFGNILLICIFSTLISIGIIAIIVIIIGTILK